MYLRYYIGKSQVRVHMWRQMHRDTPAVVQQKEAQRGRLKESDSRLGPVKPWITHVFALDLVFSKCKMRGLDSVIFRFPLVVRLLLLSPHILHPVGASSLAPPDQQLANYIFRYRVFIPSLQRQPFPQREVLSIRGLAFCMLKSSWSASEMSGSSSPLSSHRLSQSPERAKKDRTPFL